MQNPLIPMAAVVGKPTQQDIFLYLSELHQNGITQVMLYPRSGCELSYLSEEWFTAISHFIDAAQKLDMCIWLYDDFNWPSGDAQGKVTAIDRFCLQSIRTKGENIGKIQTASKHNASLFGEKRFPDLLNPDAVDYFIQCTHEAYYKRFSDYFGNVIQGIFTDEPAIGYCCDSESIPYYDGLAQDYAAACGSDFMTDLEKKPAHFYPTAMRVIAARFCTCFVEKIANWCKNHGILMTGHFMSDEAPLGATRQNGDLLKNLSAFSLPGIDEIHTAFTNPTELSLFGAAEYASGENGAMAELFALGPCDLTYAKRRCMLYFAACHKIDHYFLAISHMDLRGNLKICDFFNNFMSDQPDFAGMRLFAQEAQKAAVYAKKDYAPDVYVRYPTAVCAENINDPGADDAPFTALLRRLTHHQIQWKYLNTDDAADGAPVIEWNGDATYRFQDKTYADTDALCQKIGVNPRIMLPDGAMPDGIFVRTFTDGSVLVLNLFGAAGTYLFDGKPIILEEHGVFFGEPQAVTTQKTPVKATFALRYDRQNCIRLLYPSGQTAAKIECVQDTDVTFAVRKGAQAMLSGKPLTCTKDGACLSFGMRNLYDTTTTVRLKKGVYTVTATDDFKYLPSVFVRGDFAVTAEEGDVCSITLAPRKAAYTPGEQFSDYGKISFQTEVTVPAGATALTLTGTKLFTTVSLNGAPEIARIFAPYTYPVDRALWGKTVPLVITQSSSMAPLFGNVAYLNEHGDSAQWRNAPTPSKTLFGFLEIAFLTD